jgi:putative transposase
MTSTSPVWQRNYYEHVIRDEEALHRLREYIRDNPASWADDEENPHRQIRPAQEKP